MLSVIVDARDDARKLPALLAQLTAGAVDGLVREVLILAPAGDGIALICEETGAVRYDGLPAAAAAARSDRLMVLPADLRLRDGWLSAIGGFLAGGGEGALVEGLAGPGLFRRRPFGALASREAALKSADLDGLRRNLRLRSRVG